MQVDAWKPNPVQLDALAAWARAGSFARAAKQLGVSASMVRRQSEEAAALLGVEFPHQALLLSIACGWLVLADVLPTGEEL